MLTDPLSVTYNGSAKSLPRTSVTPTGSVYRTADGEFEVVIFQSPRSRGNEALQTSIKLVRRVPDPTPADAFDAYRFIRNSFGISYGFDLTKAESSVDIPRLRTALLSFVDSTLEGRLMSAEK